MVRRFEEISNNAWPALQSLQYDGWLLRFANGVTKRSNSVNLLYPSTLDPEEKIDFSERMFRARNIPPTFKITAISDPSDIDERLAKRDYFILSTISFQIVDLTSHQEATPDDIVMAGELNEEWIDDFIRMNGFEPERKPTYISIMNHAFTPKCLVSLKESGQTTGVGLGVLEEDCLGLFDIVVDPAFRHHGLGKKIVSSLMQWGKQNGAKTAYLQVLSNNIPAIRLYEKLGFKEIYQYWYRTKII